MSDSHRRAPLTSDIDVSQLRIDPNFLSDPRLVRTYAALERGKVKVSLTRLGSDSIHTGYFTRLGEGSIEHVSNLRAESVEEVSRMIRGGDRPLLDVYWSPHAPGGGGYVCADDETAFAAYKALGIHLVPCRVIRPKPFPGVEAAIWLEKRGSLVAFSRAVPAQIENYGSFAGGQRLSLQKMIELLVSRCVDAREAVKAFHDSDLADIHYHQMLYAALRRHERLLDSIDRLATLGRLEHGLSLTRMAYEAFLNFYVDWLSPAFFGPRLQLLSALRRMEAGKQSVDPEAWKVLVNFPGLLENASEKARVSPLGSLFHDLVYPALSLVAHQSYGHLESEASFGDDEAPQPPLTEETLAQWLDVLTAALVVRVRNEVGMASLRAA